MGRKERELNMAAANTDLFRKSQGNFSTTLSSGIDDSDTTIPLASASGLPTDTAVTLIIDRVDADGEEKSSSSWELVTGVISGDNLTDAKRGEGDTDAQSHSTGAVVECVVDEETQNDMVDGVLVEHNQDGTHKSADGWISANETWTYSSVDDPTGVITFTGADQVLSVGMRVKFDNGGNTIYGIVTAVTSTTFTFLHEMETDGSGAAVNLMADSAITNPYYSTQKVPFGFPISPLSWHIQKTGGGSRANTSWGETTSTDNRIIAPIGVWYWSLNMEEVRLDQNNSQSTKGWMDGAVAASTSDDSVSDGEMEAILHIRYLVNTNDGRLYFPVYKRHELSLASKTTLYVIAQSGGGANPHTVTVSGVYHKIVSAYL